jgi:deoxyribodipyrimidine photo-lyase
MDNTQPIAVFWFRRDLRLFDNTSLFHALVSGFKVLPVFIFDENILSKLNPDDKRVTFIWQALRHLDQLLIPYKASIQLFYGKPEKIFEHLLADYSVHKVFANHDYEPYAQSRDLKVKKVLAEKGVLFQTFKDQVIFEKQEVIKSNGEAYTVFTPYCNKWNEKLRHDSNSLLAWSSENYLFNMLQCKPNNEFRITDLNFDLKNEEYQKFELDTVTLSTYDKTRDYPALDSTSRVSVHLRFGTISIRQLVASALKINAVWLNELIWREFFMQILWNYPYVVEQPFKSKYRFVKWRNNEKDFEAWSSGHTGYALVDAGMRELNETGFMHNRVRMVTASFLVKHLLINWQWGEAYFASKLLDFELSSNNGNWQWAAGTGSDSAPYFRIFNPITQAQKFDPESIYIKRWVPEYGEESYTKPIVDHGFARSRCLETYKQSL